MVYSYAKDAQPGQVVMQDPDPGTPIDENTKPTLVVIESTKVPELKGEKFSCALVKLSAHKLVPDVIDGEQVNMEDTVKCQEPEPGTDVAVFTPVKISLTSLSSEQVQGN